MGAKKSNILTINCGSSSIKFAIYEIDGLTRQLLSGELESSGKPPLKLSFTDFNSNEKKTIDIEDTCDPSDSLIKWLEKQASFDSIKAIGHRIVHGMNYNEPQLVTQELLDELKNITVYDPDHLPEEIKWIELLAKRYPSMVQIACFDTSFHSSMPDMAKMLSIPRRYHAMGIRRYGFHGLSYAYLMDELAHISGKNVAEGKIILAHLGSGASLAAVKDGKSLDTSMGFTPASGLIMGTRTGDLDPGVARYLIQAEKMTPEQFNHLVNQESGLLGISETSPDMRELLKSQNTDHRAAQAVDLFCYQAKKWIGSFSAVLGGLDTLVFSGGIGENAPEVRMRICNGMEFLGIELDKSKNTNNEVIISTGASRVCVRVIKTNEELMIVRMVCRTMDYNIKQ